MGTKFTAGLTGVTIGPWFELAIAVGDPEIGEKKCSESVVMRTALADVAIHLPDSTMKMCHGGRGFGRKSSKILQYPTLGYKCYIRV
ncbi:hypothetical protein EDB84DRAFT_1511757 [Lactarius hengduanensis]|nr:hypothetical protein EDB84DRAFT_1511757 [Lactarius hengduanensis]